MTKETTAVAAPQAGKLIERMADQYGLDPAQFARTLQDTVFKGANREEFAALCLVAHRYNLDPILRQIYAFPRRGGGIQPLVSVDGWARLVNEHAAFDGLEFRFGEGEPPAWVECVIYRKDRQHPTVVREFLAECKRGTEAWNMPARMLRHRAFIQAARLAFGFTFGDESDATTAPTMVDMGPAVQTRPSAIETINAAVSPKVDEPTNAELELPIETPADA